MRERRGGAVVAPRGHEAVVRLAVACGREVLGVAGGLLRVRG